MKGWERLNKRTFIRQILLSSFLMFIIIAAIAGLSVMLLQLYAPPSESNTVAVTGTVTEVYFARSKGGVVVLSSGEQLQLVYPAGSLYSAVGYDVRQLADLLEGKDIQCRRMARLPWIVEIHAGDATIDNLEATVEQMAFTRAGIVVLGLILLVISIGCDVTYLQAKYQCYLKEQKKQKKRRKRDLKKVQN